MKKRILSILLTICMLFCLTPISVFAEEVGAGGSAAIQLGADALSVLSKNVNTATAPTVYFGQNHENNPAAWRVIGYDGSGVTSSKGDITLLAAGAMGVIPFVDAILNNEYAPSNLKATIDALAEKLTTEENAAVKKRTLTSGSYDGENTDCVAGGQVDNAVFWPLSAKEAIAVNNDLRALDPAHPNWVTTGWWLRSPGSDKYHLAVVRSEGSVQYSGYSVLIFNNYRTVRPAFNLNMNSVLFASAAVGGKPDGGLTEVSKYSGNEWKLTLLDSRRNFAVTEKTVSAAPDDTVTLNYKGATTGKNEYISVILADNNGAQYYGRVAQPTTESGTVEIKIPSDIAPGDYTMKVFSEQYNGDCKTDLASAFADVTLTVESQPDEQFTLAPGGRYYFDLSAMDIPGTVNSNLPDSTLHYVPFTYAGTVDAYVLKPASNHVEDSSEQASVTKDKNAQYGYAYEHSLFIADYRVTTDISWIDLNNAGFIFGKTNTAGGINYTLRAPTMGSIYKSPMRGVPANNEWDQILTKNSDFIKELGNNHNISLFWGQDTSRSYDFKIRIPHGIERQRLVFGINIFKAIYLFAAVNGCPAYLRVARAGEQSAAQGKNIVVGFHIRHRTAGAVCAGEVNHLIVASDRKHGNIGRYGIAGFIAVPIFIRPIQLRVFRNAVRAGQSLGRGCSKALALFHDNVDPVLLLTGHKFTRPQLYYFQTVGGKICRQFKNGAEADTITTAFSRAHKIIH